jgi:ribosomal protein S24E
MDIEILKEKDMQLLSRKRVSAMIQSEGPTPSRLDLKKQLAKKLNKDPELVILKHIYPKYGKSDVKVIAHVYDNKEELEKFELKKLVEKHKEPEVKKEEAPAPAEKKPAEEAPAAEEKPAEEEKKEEAPAEEKPAEKEEKKEAEKPAE